MGKEVFAIVIYVSPLFFSRRHGGTNVGGNYQARRFSHEEKEHVFLSLAAGKMSEKELNHWLAAHSV